MNVSEKTIRLDVFRHLQDFNGYCGPACALMVVEFTGSTKSPPVFAQNELFKEIRSYATSSQDRRPVKSPAESLLSMLNDHTASEVKWVKVFNPDPFPVAREIFLAIEQKQQPCLLLVSKGMHWVVAFGVQRMDDGRPAGFIMRDPAWTGMPKFYGLSIFPETPAIEHTPSPCQCLTHLDEPPGCVHERYITVPEMLSSRGLQGSPDWEGKGAIAIVPDDSVAAAVTPDPAQPQLSNQLLAATIIANPREQAGAAALAAVKENGLFGRPDSPQAWDATLTGATAGEPILVKDPEDPADDFFLVPLNPADPHAKHGAWAMLDTNTLALREVSLLENWQSPAFPSDDSRDAEIASRHEHTLADGTVARFTKEDLTPNTQNLVWAPSAASVLPYWPLKELLATHPITGQPVSIYVNQEGEVFSQLAPDNIEPAAETFPAEHPPQAQQPAIQSVASTASKIPKALSIILGVTSLGLLATTGYLATSDKPENDQLREQVKQLQTQAEDRKQKIQEQEQQLEDTKKKTGSLRDQASKDIAMLNTSLEDLKTEVLDKDEVIGKQKLRIEDHLKGIAELKEKLAKNENELNLLNTTQQKKMDDQQDLSKQWQLKYSTLNKEKEALKKQYEALAIRTNELNTTLNRQTKELQQLKFTNQQNAKLYRDLQNRYQLLLNNQNRPRPNQTPTPTPRPRPNQNPELDPIKPADTNTLNQQLKLLQNRWTALNNEIRRAKQGSDTRKLQSQKNQIEQQMNNIRSQLNRLKR